MARSCNFIWFVASPTGHRSLSNQARQARQARPKTIGGYPNRDACVGSAVVAKIVLYDGLSFIIRKSKKGKKNGNGKGNVDALPV